MKQSFLLLILLLTMSAMTTSCNGTYSGGGGGGGYVDDSYDDDYWYDDDDDWYDDSDDDWYDDSDDDWYDDDDDWYDDGWDDYDDDDDGCWDCGDDWGWYDDSQRESESHSTDIMGDVAAKEEARLAKGAEFFTNKFNLSDDQGLKLAKTLQDYKALNERTAQDLAEFSQKLYGLNPEDIVTSISSAQVGDHSKLDAMIDKAAKSFDTTTQNMREIIKSLHGQALKENGIEL